MKLLLLLAVGLDLAWAQQDQSQVPVQQGFSSDQVTGAWKTLNLASTNRSVIEEGGAYQCFMTGIVRLANGNLNVTYFHRKDGKCVKEFLVAEKTDIPGRYTFEYQGKNYLTFVAVTKDFLIMDYENHNDGNILIVAELLGKLGLVAYLKHTARRGIGAGNIADVSLDHCPFRSPRKQYEPISPCPSKQYKAWRDAIGSLKPLLWEPHHKLVTVPEIRPPDICRPQVQACATQESALSMASVS